MNTPTLIASLIMAAVLVLLIAFLIRQMMRGWRHRAQRQAELIGTLPPLPDTVGPAIIPATKGLYVGSTIAPSWQDRVAVGDLGFRSKAMLTRYPRESCCSAAAPARSGSPTSRSPRSAPNAASRARR